MELRNGTPLQGGKYRIIRALGQGGFGITYLAEHTTLGAKVCIKEFFIKDYCNRGDNGIVQSVVSENSNIDINRYKRKFLEEARKVSQIKHPHIVGVSDLFEENNTAYYVMEYIDGVSLSDIVKRRRTLPEVEAVRYITQAASALKHIHDRNILHLDIKPANIMVRTDGDMVVLIDFGLAKHYDAETGHQTTTYLAAHSPGYAPFEQGLAGGGVKMFCPATDIYALGATLYTLVTGECPPEAAIIPSAGLPELPSTLSHSTRKVITSSMEYSIKKRPQSVTEFISILGSEDLCNSGRVVQSTTDDTIIQRPYVERVSTSENTSGVNRNTRNNATNLARTAVENHFNEVTKCGFMIGSGQGYKVTTEIRVNGILIVTIVSQPNNLGGVTLYAKSTEHTICLTKLMNRCNHFEIRANETKFLGNNADAITSLIAEYISEIDPSITSDRVEILNKVTSNRQFNWLLASLPIAGVLYVICNDLLMGFEIINVDKIALTCCAGLFPIANILVMFKSNEYGSSGGAKMNRVSDILFIAIISVVCIANLISGSKFSDGYYDGDGQYVYDPVPVNSIVETVCIFLHSAVVLYSIIKSVLLYKEFGNREIFINLFILIVGSLIFIPVLENEACLSYIVSILMFFTCSFLDAFIRPVRISKIKA